MDDSVLADLPSAEDLKLINEIADLLDYAEIDQPNVSSPEHSVQSSDEAVPVKVVKSQHYYRQRQKDERKYLHEQVQELSSQLSVLTTMKSLEAEQCSHWEKVARTQKLGSQKATLENARLKRALEDQIKLAEALDQLLVKRPRLATFPTADVIDWKLRKLPIDDARRQTTFHAMLDDAYDHVDTSFLHKGLYDLCDNHRSLDVTTNEKEDNIIIDVQSVKQIENNYLNCSNNFWALFQNNEHINLPNAHLQVLERFGNDGFYFTHRALMPQKNPYSQYLWGVKRYFEKNRVVLVFKTVLEDERYPPVPGLYIGNHSAAIIVEAVDELWCRRRMSMLGQLPVQPPELSPLSSNPSHFICEFIMHQISPTFEAIESLVV
ncbi:hypothetical protein THRCLA_06985 [Thraustotheca clavata]|uniref:Uncharacterized protein n=1 Tax=Thraustotheca clavata TaxID=74557 RepID=A0A1V9ZHC7_9STRA|nr:hypothetical protein THRCLA_06985 [Thraustotheca clavata]